MVTITAGSPLRQSARHLQTPTTAAAAEIPTSSPSSRARRLPSVGFFGRDPDVLIGQ